MLQGHFPDPDILLNKDRMEERYALCRDNELPAEMMHEVSKTYVGLRRRSPARSSPSPTTRAPRSLPSSTRSLA